MAGNDIDLGLSLNTQKLDPEIKQLIDNMKTLVEQAKQFSTAMGDTLQELKGIKALSGSLNLYAKGDLRTQTTHASTRRAIAEQDASSELVQTSKLLTGFLSQLNLILKAHAGEASLLRGKAGIGAPAATSVGIREQIGDNRYQLAFQLDAQKRLQTSGASAEQLQQQATLIASIEAKQQELNAALAEATQLEKEQAKYGTQILSISERIKIVEAEIVAARIEGLGAETEFALQRERQELMVKKALAESNGQFTAAVEQQIQGMATLQKMEQQRLETLKEQAAQAKQEAAARKEATAALQQQMQQQMKTIGQPTQAFLDQRKQEEAIRRNVLSIDKEIALVEAEINAKKGGTDAAELRKLELKKQQLVLDRELVQSERMVTAEVTKQIGVIAGLEAENARLGQQERANSGLLNRKSPGALFAIQADLLANYFIMNQIFKLFSFGSQYVTELDKNFRDLQATIAATDTEMVDLKKTVIDASTGTRFSAVEVAKATVTLGQAGLSVDQIKKTIRPIIEFATATGSDLSASLDVASSAMNVFEIEAGQMGNVVNIMTESINDSKLDVQKLTTGIQYAGNVVAQSGGQFEEFIAILGAAANSGIKSGSTIGTGLRQVFTEFLEPSKKLLDVMVRLNIPMAALNVRSNGLIGVFRNLKEAGFTTADAFKSMDLRAAAMYAAISHNLDVAEKLDQQFLLTSAATKANETQMKSLSNTTDRFANDLGVLIEQGLGPLRDQFQGLLEHLNGFLEGMSKTPGILGPVVTSVTTFVGVLAALSILFKTFSGLTALLFTGGALSIGGGIAAVLAGAVAGYELFSTLGESAAKAAPSIDQLTAAVHKSSEALQETRGNMESVDSAIDELGQRYPTLSQNQEALRTESLKLQNKFGDLGITFDTNKMSVESLRASLQDLRRELQQLASVQAYDALQKQVQLLTEMKIQLTRTSGVQLSQFPGLDLNNYQGLVNKSSGLRDATILSQRDLPAIQQEMTDLNPDIKAEREKAERDLQQLQQRFLKALIQLQKDMQSVNTKLPEGDTTLGFSKQQLLQNLGEAIDQIQSWLSKTTATSKTLGDIDLAEIDKQYADAKKNAVYNILQSTLETASQHWNDLQTQLSNNKDDTGKTLTDEQRKTIQKEMDSMKQFFVDTFSNIADKFKGDPLFQTQGGQKALGDLDSQIAKEEGERRKRLDGEIDLAKIRFDKVSESQNQFLQKAEQLYQHATDATDQKIKHFDYLIRESQDTVRGSLRGIFGDADIELFKDQQKQLQNQRLAEQQAALKTYISQYDSSIGAIGGAVAGLKTPMDGDPTKIANYIAANKGLLDLEEKRRQLEQQLVDVNDQLAISQGNVTETGMTMGQAFEYALDREMQASAQASDLRLNMVAIVHELSGNFSTAFGTFFSDVLTGTKSVSEGFRAMAGSMLQSLAKVVNDVLAQQFWQLLAGGFAKSTGFSGWLGNTFFGANSGGMVPRNYATGGANPNRDSVNARLRPGEFVVRKSAVDMIGVDNLRAMNAMGNNAVSRSAGTMQMPEPKRIESNIYLLAPDQKPSLGPNDVKYIIGQDILTGGATKSLIKQVVAGA